MRSPEPDLYRDKIEISLDGRQVFYLFFGGAVIACLVFVLGVMVGRRVEARAHVDGGAATTAARDPLTALDQLDATARADMSFRSTLAGGKPAAAVDEAAKAIDAARAEKDAAAKAAAAEAAAKQEAAKQAAARPPVAKVEAVTEEVKVEPVKAPEPAPDPDKGRFTLQLSSFKDKTEAESFQWELKQAGYRAYLVEADVPGKGTFWRVRFGKYKQYEDALAAKSEFEEKMNKIAYVTRL